MDQDLKAYLDQQFSSLGLVVQQQIQQLREETGQQFQELREETGQQFQQLREETGQQFQQLRDDVAQLSLRLDRVEARLDALEVDVRKAYILIEDLRGQIQLVAEGVANANEKLDRHRGEVSQEIEEIKAFTRRAYEDLDVRVRRLEAAAG